MIYAELLSRIESLGYTHNIWSELVADVVGSAHTMQRALTEASEDCCERAKYRGASREFFCNCCYLYIYLITQEIFGNKSTRKRQLALRLVEEVDIYFRSSAYCDELSSRQFMDLYSELSETISGVRLSSIADQDDKIKFAEAIVKRFIGHMFGQEYDAGKAPVIEYPEATAQVMKEEILVFIQSQTADVGTDSENQLNLIESWYPYAAFLSMNTCSNREFRPYMTMNKI